MLRSMARAGRDRIVLGGVSRREGALDRPEDVLRFWFGRLPGPRFGVADALWLPSRIPCWGGHWARRLLDVDGIVGRYFGDTHRLAADGALAHWEDRPEGRLALIIVLDQLSRNLYRGTPAAFAQDARTLPIVERALELGDNALVADRSTWAAHLDPGPGIEPIPGGMALEGKSANVAYHEGLSLDTFTIEAMLKPDPLSGYVASMKNTAGAVLFNYALHLSGGVRVFFDETEGAYHAHTGPSGVAGTWNTVFGSYEGGVLSAGANQSETSLGTVVGPPGKHVGPLVFGRSPSSGGTLLGVFRTVRISSKALSADRRLHFPLSGWAPGVVVDKNAPPEPQAPEGFAQSRSLNLFEPAHEVASGPGPSPAASLVSAEHSGGASTWWRSAEPVEVPLVNGILDGSLRARVVGPGVFTAADGGEVLDLADPGNEGASALTVLARFRVDEIGPWQAVVSQWDGPGDRRFVLHVRPQGGIGWSLSDGSTASYDLVSTKAIEAGQEVSVAAVYESGDARIYIDGLLEELFVESGAPITAPMAAGGPTAYVGACHNCTTDAGTPDWPFAGRIRDVVVLGHRLSPGEIAAWASSGTSYGSTLVPGAQPDFDDVRISEDGYVTPTEIVGIAPQSDGGVEGLRGHWPLDGDTLGRFGDDGGATTFDGDPFVTSLVPALEPGHGVTVEAWIRSPLVSTAVVVGSRVPGAETVTLMVNPLGAVVEFGDDDDFAQFPAPAVLHDGRWHHLAFTRDPVAGWITVYVDGVEAGGGADVTDGIVGTQALWIGGANAAGVLEQPFAGVIDDVVVHDHARSPGYLYDRANGLPRIRFLASTWKDKDNDGVHPWRGYRLHWDSDDAGFAAPTLNGCPGLLSACSGTAGWWRFDHSFGGIVPDRSAAGAHASIGAGASIGPGGLVSAGANVVAAHHSGLVLPDFTVETMAKTGPVVAKTQVFASDDTADTASNYALFLDGEPASLGKLRLDFEEPGGSPTHSVIHDTLAVAAAWGHYAGSRGDAALGLAVNHVPWANTVPNTPPPGNGGADLWFGKQASGAKVFDGTLRSVRISTRALKPEEHLHFPAARWMPGPVSQDVGYDDGAEVDNCPGLVNPEQIDADADGAGDACDPCPMDPGDACASSLLGWWPLDDPFNLGMDISGNGRDGEVFGDVTGGQAGIRGRSARFESHEFETGAVVESGRICIQDDGWTASMNDGFSIEAWVRPTRYSTTGSGVQQHHTVVGKNGVLVLRYGSDWAPLEGRSSSWTANTLVGGTLPIGFGDWHHLATTWDPGEQVASFYVDGVLDSTAIPTAQPALSAGGQVCISGQTNQEWVTGWIDDVKIWSQPFDYSADSDGDGIPDVVDETRAVPDVACPAPAAWEPREPMLAPLAYTPLVGLGDHLWVIGGTAGGTSAKTERYDIRTDSWVYGPDLPETRSGVAAAAWGDTFYLFGGVAFAVAAKGHALRYDPDPEEFVSIAEMPVPAGFAGAAVYDDAIHVLGGADFDGGAPVNDHRVYDPASDSWTQPTTLPWVARSLGVAAAADRLWIAGGVVKIGGEEVALSTLWSYEPAAGWTGMGSLATPALASPVVAVDHMLAVLSPDAGGSATTTLDLYDTRAGRWLAGPGLLSSAASGSATVHHGRVYAAGGLAPSPSTAVASLPASAIVDPPGWSYAAPLPEARVGHGLARAGHRLIVAGGEVDGTITASARRYDPEADVWEPIGGLVEPKGTDLATLGGTVRSVGGDVGDSFTSSHCAWDPHSQSFVAWKALPGGAREPSLCVADDRLWAIAGDMIGGNTLSTVEVYDPQSNDWASLVPPILPLGVMDAEVAAVDDWLYVVGGVLSASVPLVKVLELGPPYASWDQPFDIEDPHRGGDAGALRDRIVVVGGTTEGGAGDAVRVFDPASGEWTSGPPLLNPRDGARVASIGDRLYVAGGAGEDGAPIDAVEVASWADLSCPQAPTQVSNLLLSPIENCVDISATTDEHPVTAHEELHLTVTGAMTLGAGEISRDAFVFFTEAGRKRVVAISPGKATWIRPEGQTVRLFVTDVGQCGDNTGEVVVTGLASPVVLSASQDCVETSLQAKSPAGPLIAGGSYTLSVSEVSETGPFGPDVLIRHARTVGGTFVSWAATVRSGHRLVFTAGDAGFYAVIVDDDTCLGNPGEVSVLLRSY